MLTLGIPVVGVTDLPRAVAFWTAALGLVERAEWPSVAQELRAETVRLLGLGARRVEWDSYPDDPDFVVLADPDDNVFCIVDLGHAPSH